MAAASPAQDLFDQAAYLVIVNYGGFSSTSPKVLEVQFQLELDKACAAQVDTCPFTAAHPVITRMLEALKDGHSAFLPAESLQGLNNVLRGTTLIVDDDEAVRSIAATVLEMHGAGVRLAASGEEALELLRTQGHGISLVLLDMTMPGIGGEETLRRMRQLDAALPVIVMSGYSETDTMQRCAHLGVVRFIQKPFEIDTLLTAAKSFLS